MAVKNSQRFAEIERLMGDYFGCHLATVRLASYAHWPLPICLVMTHTPR